MGKIFRRLKISFGRYLVYEYRFFGVIVCLQRSDPTKSVQVCKTYFCSNREFGLMTFMEIGSLHSKTLVYKTVGRWCSVKGFSVLPVLGSKG